MPINVLQWRLVIGKFYSFSAKKLKDTKTSGLILFLTIKLSLMSTLNFLWYILMNFIIRIVFSSFLIFPIFLYTCLFLKETFFTVIRYNFNFIYIFSIFIIYLLYYIRFFRLSGDIELNPGPKPNSFKNFSICHWNLSSITSHKFLKVKLLSAYNAIQKFDIICISESYLNSDILSSDEKLNITGYDMFRADHPSGDRRGGVCIYYKETLPIKELKISYLQESICFDLKIGNKLCSIVSLYRSPSQTSDEFENFLNNLNLTLE